MEDLLPAIMHELNDEIRRGHKMGVLSYVKYDNLSEEAKKIYDEKAKKSQKITNMVKTLLHSAPSFRAMEFYPIRDELVKVVGKRAVYYYCYAISSEDACIICTTYHAKLLKEMNLKPEEFKFTEIEKVLIDYGRALVKNPHNVSRDIFTRLKKHFNDEQIVLITTVGCRMIASNLFNSALQIDLDEYLYNVDLDDHFALPE
jgi:hypothetical protein